jgi:hypothetical protein
MKGKRCPVFGMVVIVACASSVGCRPAAEDPAAPTLSEGKSQSGMGNAERSVQRSISLDSLPPEEVPLREAIRDLERRAAQGDAQASCRLAAEYNYCEAAKVNLGKFERQLSDIEKAKNVLSRENVAFIALDADAVTRQVEHCAGVAIPSHAQRFKYLRDAALRGHLPSLVEYSLGRFSGRLTILDELKVYRNEAVPLAERAARAGSARALLALAAAYSPPGYEAVISGMFREIVEPDPVEALTLYYHLRNSLESDPSMDARRMREEADKAIAQLLKEVSSEKAISAAEEARRRRAAWKPISIDIQTSGGFIPGTTSMRDPSRAICAEPVFVE